MASVSTAAVDHKPILAERFKTKMCRNHQVHGVCPYEQRCMFAHGEEDLRTKDMNMAAQLTTEEAIKDFQRARYAAKARDAMLAVAAESLTPVVDEREVEVLKLNGDGSFSHNPYAKWFPFYVSQRALPRSMMTSPVRAPAEEHWVSYQCTCPGCEGAVAPVLPPKYVADIAPRHKVLVP